MWHKLRDFVQKQILDRFYWFRCALLNRIVWLAIRCAAYEVAFAHVREKKKPSNRLHSDLNLDGAGDLDGLLSHAEGQVKDAVARRSVVNDKCKSLFTFNTALLALIAVFQAKTADLSSWESLLFYLAVIAFVVALLVLWTYFDVSGEFAIPLEQDFVSLSQQDLKKSLTNSNLQCASDLENRTDYLVDLYRTSRFYMMSGFVLLFIVFSHSYFIRSNLNETDRVINKLRDDPQFRDIIKKAK